MEILLSSKSITPFLPMITMCLKRNDKRTDALKKKNERGSSYRSWKSRKKKKEKAEIYKDLHTNSILHFIYVSTHI